MHSAVPAQEHVGGRGCAAGVPHLADRAARLARDSVIARGDLLAAGVDPRVLRRECASGRWTLLLPGVALVGGGEPTPRQRCRAALAAAGPGAALTGAAGCRLWDLVDVPRRQVVDVVVPRARRVAPHPLLRAHRSTGPYDVWQRDGLPVAGADRCVADAARDLTDLREVRALVLPAVRGPWMNAAGLLAVLAGTGSAGSALCRRALADAARGAWSAPEAEAAELVVRAVRRRALPPAVLNAQVRHAGDVLGTVDGWLIGTGVGWELDSVRHHGGAVDLDATLERHERFAAAGLVLLHRAPSRLRRAPSEFVAALRVLAARTPAPAGLELRAHTPALR